MAEYDRMSRYEAAEGITVVYASMYGNTRRMAESVAAGAAKAGIKNNIFDLRHNIPLVSAVNSNGVLFTGNIIITKKANVAEASLFRLINTPVLENSNNLYTSQH